MATRTLTTMQSQSLQKSQLLHLVGSKDITAPHLPKRSSSSGPYFSAHREIPSPRFLVDSFDAPPESSVWKTRPSTSTSEIRQWAACRYYQYEVTWGLYVLTPGEKVVINSLVLFIFSLIAYAITNVAIFQHAVGIVIDATSALVGTAYLMARPLCDWIIHYALGTVMEAFGGV